MTMAFLGPLKGYGVLDTILDEIQYASHLEIGQ